ncbi:hypothetical protein [Methylobacterium oxalidis]|uniref:Uncharacterized protein n=1 Tax=Methylobacterium oxalidis TaxID=944322 RepID=A0A512JB28_9HYPH|nr:hypothetical protein [Methylobacterium oxalidis]GEP07162.1 hypothetical protein MOX02_52000 [Methylobacterium oxalidis]GJE31111.1 hypothetical protein LDDCCGHA_1284 [Methylobacterium oxalidis]GLS64425.1 hypothetical protein GCM10007888_28060 [Methylobacterium oxalidis]
MTDLLRSVGLSRYELNARLKPALLALLPTAGVALFWYPGAWSTVGSIVAAGSACGVLYAIAQLARNRGRAVERGLKREVGRDHSARLLTHADDTLLAETKARYHAYLRSHDKVLSTADEERAGPEVAFCRARSAVDWLLEHTRTGGGAALLLDENISYGFQRNLLGLKPFGIGLSAIAIVVHVLLLSLATPGEERFWVGVAVCIPLAALLFWWVFFVTKGAVAEASLAYAQRLLANCEPAVTTPRPRRISSGSSKSAPPPAMPRQREVASEP